MPLKQLAKKVTMKGAKKLRKRKVVTPGRARKRGPARQQKKSIKKEEPIDNSLVIMTPEDVEFDKQLKSLSKKQQRQDIAQSGGSARVTGQYFTIGAGVGGAGAIGGGYYAYDNVALKRYRKMGQN